MKTDTKAEVILMKCPETKRIYGVRVEEWQGDWFRTWAFPIEERKASHEGFDKTKIRGNLYPADEYNGCPYCKSVCYVQCSRCGKLSCWNSEERISCAWCGLTGDVSRIEDEIGVKGGDY